MNRTRPVEHTELPAGSEEDRQLALAFQSGEKGAYAAIYERHSPRVHAVCRRMLCRREDAAEAAQETFLRVYLGLERFNGRYQMGAWITRIATNVCLDQLRSQSRRPYESATLELAELNPLDSHDDDPESLMLRQSEGRRVRRVLRSLPPMHRAAIVLREYEGLSYGEIAATLELSESQVKALLHRARRGFRRSWRAGIASVFLPLRPWHRIRELDNPATTDAARSLVATAQSAVCACSGAFQSFGQVVAERAAAAATALAVAGSAATLGAAAAPAALTTPDRGASSERTEIVASAQGERRSTSNERERGARDNEAPAEVPEPAEPVESPAPAPTPEPSPSPSPSPAPSPSPGPQENPTTSPNPGGNKPPPGTPAPVAAPQTFAPQLAFDQGQPIYGGGATEHEFAVDCAGIYLRERLAAPIGHRDGFSAALFAFEASSSVGFELTVDKNNTTVRYSGGGPLISSSRSGDDLELYYQGSYGTGGPARAANLPEGGGFSLRLSLDCAARSVVSLTAVFH